MNETRAAKNAAKSMIRTGTKRKYCRNDLYLSDDSGYHGCTMPDMLSDFIDSVIYGVDCKGSTDAWMHRAKRAEIEINGEDYIISDHCLFVFVESARAIILVFVDANGILNCGYQLTYDMVDISNFNLFMSKTHINENQYCIYESLLYGVLHLIRLHQIRAYEVGGNTTSVIYTNNPKSQEFELPEGYVYHDYSGFTKRRLLSELTINNILCARLKGISEEAISRVYPEDIEAKLMVRDLTELEIAQINALEPDKPYPEAE